MAGLLHLYRLSTDVAVVKMYSLNIYKLYTAVLKPCSAFSRFHVNVSRSATAIQEAMQSKSTNLPCTSSMQTLRYSNHAVRPSISIHHA